ncbi:MAG: FliM/FliN family flagellar motor switch protein [Verrucomicrobiota bacterium]
MTQAPNPPPAATPPACESQPPPVAVQPLDLRASSLLSPRQLRALRAHEEQFLDAASARVSLFLRSEFPLKLASIQVVSYQKLTETWAAPAHLTLFKTEPLRGVSILDIEVPLALAIVDRLMGGPGKAAETARQLSEIERALLDQIVQILLEEWCNNWASLRPLKPSILGCESNGRFLQTAPPQASMLAFSIEACSGDGAGRMQLAFPYAALEPLLRQLCPEAEPAAHAPAPLPQASTQWNRGLDDVSLPVTAEWREMELSARDILHLKVGDVLQVGPQLARQVSLRLGELPKFNGRLGTLGGAWAVEITQPIHL